MNKSPSIIENQSQKGSLLYSEISPGFDKGKLNNKMFNYYQHQPQNNILYQKQPCDYYRPQLRQSYQHRPVINLPVKLNQNSLVLPCIYKKSGNNRPYYEFEMPNCYARGLKDHSCSNIIKLSTNDEQEINYDMEPHDDPINVIIDLVNDSYRQLNDKLQEFSITGKYNKQYHFDESKDVVEHLKITENWNDALKDIGCVKNYDFDSWYKNINQRPMHDIQLSTKNNNRFFKPKKMYSYENCLRNPSFCNDYLGPDLKYKRDPERYDEVNNWASCRCS